ncbi:MAG: NUDIX hydrolase [Candidatus Nanoarchaeia archaeon]
MLESFRARVGVVILNENKLLLLRYLKQNPPAIFLPGGVVRLGEKLEEAAKREVKAQTNLNIELQKLLYIYDNIKENGNKHRLDIFFLAKAKNIQELNQNFSDIKLDWINVDLLPSIDINPKIIKDQLLKDWKEKFKSEAKYLRD